MNRIVPAVVFVVASVATARADEETDTRMPAPSPTPAFSIEAFSIRTWGSRSAAEEIFRERDPFGWRTSWSSDGYSLDMSSSQTARFRMHTRFQGGGELRLFLSRDRRAAVLGLPRSPGPDDDGGTTFETLRAEYRRSFGATDTGAAYSSWRSIGRKPASALDPASAEPSWRSADSRVSSASIWAARTTGNLHVRTDVGVREDLARRRLDAGNLTLRGDDVRRTTHASVRADGSLRPALLAGGGWSIESFRSDPTASRRHGAGSFASGDVDLQGIRQRAALGAAFSPVPSLRTTVTGRATILRQSGYMREMRDLATPQVVAGSSRRADVTGELSGDAEWRASSALTLQVRGEAAMRRDDARWAQTFSSSGGGAAGRRVEDVIREQRIDRAEVSFRTSAAPRLRASVGGRVERERWSVDANEAVDTSTIGALDRDRLSLFASTRTHVRKLAVEVRAAGFQEERETSASRVGIDLRARVAGAAGPASFFGTIAYGDDSYESAPAAADLSGYAPFDLRTRSWISSGGATASSGRIRGSLTASHVLLSSDLRSELTEIACEISTPLAATTGVSTSVRWMRWHEPVAPWSGASALGATLTLTGSF